MNIDESKMVIPYRLSRQNVRELEMGDKIKIPVNDRVVHAKVTRVEE